MFFFMSDHSAWHSRARFEKCFYKEDPNGIFP